jgi:hypothetical protein
MLCVMFVLQRTGSSGKNPGGKGVKRMWMCSICSGAHLKNKCPTLKRDQQQCSASQDGIADEERMSREDADFVAYRAPLEREDGEDADEPRAPLEGSSRCPSLKPDECSATHEGIAMPKWRDILLDGGGPVLAKAGCSPDVGIKSGVLRSRGDSLSPSRYSGDKIQLGALLILTRPPLLSTLRLLLRAHASVASACSAPSVKLKIRCTFSHI